MRLPLTEPWVALTELPLLLSSTVEPDIVPVPVTVTALVFSTLRAPLVLRVPSLTRLPVLTLSGAPFDVLTVLPEATTTEPPELVAFRLTAPEAPGANV